MDELPADVDATRHARYWNEAFNGVVMACGFLLVGYQLTGYVLGTP